MPIIPNSMEGLAIYGAPPLPVLLDFAMNSTDGRCLMAECNWWKGEWGLGAGIRVYATVLVQETDSYWWRTPDKRMTVGPVEEEELIQEIKNERALQDSPEKRKEYMDCLEQFQTQLDSNFDLSPWIKMFAARPIVDLMALALQEAARPRKVAVILLHQNSDGRVIDALVLDEFSRADTANELPWISSMGSQWIANAGSGTLEAYVESILELPSHSPVYITSKGIKTRSGTGKQIAKWALLKARRLQHQRSLFGQ